jgi:hypothetical protein
VVQSKCAATGETVWLNELKWILGMQAHRIETIVESDGSVTVAALPFRPGEQVEVIILPIVLRPTADKPYPLRGMVYRYDRPTDPVAEEDWEALR